MRVQLNGAWHELCESSTPAEIPAAHDDGETDSPAQDRRRALPVPPTLASLLVVCGYGGAVVATAVNGEFVPAGARREVRLREGDRVEVLAPMQGG